MDVSIIICTYNRAECLRETIRSLKNQQIDASMRHEIIIVDNNSRDQTRQVVEDEAKGSRTPLRYFFEPRQGKSFALNRGIEEAEGEWIFFLDDDVIPRPDWLAELYLACVSHQVDCVGGKVLPLWEAEPPDWLKVPERQLGMLGLLDRGEHPFFLEEPNGNFVIGANMAYRREIFKTLGKFRTDIGPRGDRIERGDDSEMVKRIFLAGKKILYAPSAVVKHKVPGSRLSLRYMRKWQYDAGKSFARISVRKSARAPRWLWRECVESGVQAVWNNLRGARLEAVSREENFWNRLGMIAEISKRK